MRFFRRAAADQGGFTLVELLVVMTIMGIITGAITSVVISSFRLENRQQTFSEVITDGRVSLQRIRSDLRSARRVHEDSNERALRIWVDRDQDQKISDDEQLCFVVEEFGTSGQQWQVAKWANAVEPEHCVPGLSAPPAPRQVVARTLTSPEVFSYTPMPAEDPLAAPTREVDINLVLEVVDRDNFSETTVRGSVRLRNVP